MEIISASPGKTFIGVVGVINKFEFRFLNLEIVARIATTVFLICFFTLSLLHFSFAKVGLVKTSQPLCDCCSWSVNRDHVMACQQSSLFFIKTNYKQWTMKPGRRQFTYRSRRLSLVKQMIKWILPRTNEANKEKISTSKV